MKQYKLKEILDFSEIKNLFKHFKVTTGLDVTLYDEEGKALLSHRIDNSICSIANNHTKCTENIKYGGEKAKELGEPYIFRCGCGLIMCSSPVVFYDKLIGSVVCGPVMLWDYDEYAANELKKNLLEMDIKSDIDFKLIKQLSCVDMTSASYILYILINFMCKEQQKYLEQRLEIAKQKKIVTEFINEKQNININNINLSKYSDDLEKKLIVYVQLGNKNKAKEVINNYLSYIFLYAGGNMDIIKAKLYEFTAFLSRAAIEAGASLSDMLPSIKNSAKLFSENIEFQDLCFITIEILYDFIDKVYKSKGSKTNSNHLIKATEYIDNHFFEDITLESLSKVIFVSTYYLSHLFREQLNMTFSDYLNNKRIEKAKKMLADSNYNIEIISEKTGFKNKNYFSTTFKKIVGLSPAKYKKMIKK